MVLAAGVLGAAASTTAGYLFGDPRRSPFGVGPTETAAPLSATPSPVALRHTPSPMPAASPLPPEPLPRFGEPELTGRAQPVGKIFGLPGEGNSIALTVDDGLNSAVISGYAEFIKETGMRVTFFVTGSYDGWKNNVEALGPLIETGHVQLANHTWTHPSLLKLSDQQIVDELLTCEDFLATTFGVSGKPYFRPPYGYIDDRVQAVAASVGYTVPVLWYGTLADAGLLEPWQLKEFARKWLTAQKIVIGHANFLTVTKCFDEIHAIIHARKLQPVTLDDVFLRA
jgi:peptidoglycan/xylan/chitin deacetylase (PgdA/CDA1 family)